MWQGALILCVVLLALGVYTVRLKRKSRAKRSERTRQIELTRANGLECHKRRLDVDSSPITVPRLLPEGKPYYMLVDTETLEPIDPLYRQVDGTKTPTLLALSWQILTERGECLEETTYILRRDGLRVAPEAEALHGITTAQMREQGQAPQAVLEHWCKAMIGCKVMVAHNLDFHLEVLQHALLEAGMLCPAIQEAERLCTMHWGEQLGFKHNYQGKCYYPSLVELFRYLYYGHQGIQIVYSNKGLKDIRLLSASVRYAIRAKRRRISIQQSD